RLQSEGHHLDDPPGDRLQRGRFEQTMPQIVRERVEPRIRAAPLSELVEEDLDRVRFALHRAEHVEADDIAGSLPDAVERRLAIKALHKLVGNEAVAAMAFERLRDELRRALARPIFCR